MEIEESDLEHSISSDVLSHGLSQDESAFLKNFEDNKYFVPEPSETEY